MSAVLLGAISGVYYLSKKKNVAENVYCYRRQLEEGLAYDIAFTAIPCTTGTKYNYGSCSCPEYWSGLELEKFDM